MLNKGYKPSNYRRLIIDYICNTRTITDVEELWFYLKRQCNISYAAVYANLRILVKEGVLIKESVSVSKKETYYVLNYH